MEGATIANTSGRFGKQKARPEKGICRQTGCEEPGALNRIIAFALWSALDRALFVGTGCGLEHFRGALEGRGDTWLVLAGDEETAGILAVGVPSNT